jgi:hypothetical protein
MAAAATVWVRVLGVCAACALALGCSMGGQSSDDGAPKDGGYMPPDAGRDTGVDAAEPDTDTEIVVGGHLDGPVIIGCGAGLRAADEPIEAVTNARQRCEGWQGWYECSCDGEPKLSHAYSCGVALFQACGVPPERLDGSGRPAPIATECTAFDSQPFGRCELAEDERSYECGCEPPLAEPRPPLDVPAPDDTTHASCEQALFSACTQGCSDGFGACEPNTDGTINAYDCTCETNGLSRVALERSCEQALERACSPFEIIETHCSGYGGYCESIDPLDFERMRCTCADGEVHEVDHVTREQEPRLNACRDTLEATCGLGAPPDEALCMAEGNGYLARCTRAPRPSARHVCECYAAGSLDSRFQNPDLDVCDESALRELCPEIAPLEADARAMACAHLETCGTRITDFTLEACVSRADDVCIACVLGELSRATMIDDRGCPSSRVDCHALCENIVPKDEAVEACVARAAEHGPVTAETRCMCDRCYPAFGACLADEGCTEIFLCAVEQGCEGSSCASDPVCGTIIARHFGPGMGSVALAIDVGACEQQDECAALLPE